MTQAQATPHAVRVLAASVMNSIRDNTTEEWFVEHAASIFGETGSEEPFDKQMADMGVVVATLLWDLHRGHKLLIESTALLIEGRNLSVACRGELTAARARIAELEAQLAK